MLRFVASFNSISQAINHSFISFRDIISMLFKSFHYLRLMFLSLRIENCLQICLKVWLKICLKICFKICIKKSREICLKKTWIIFEVFFETFRIFLEFLSNKFRSKLSNTFRTSSRTNFQVISMRNDINTSIVINEIILITLK